MPLQLSFRIEDRAGAMVLITRRRGSSEEVVRPASAAEVELWNALTQRFAAPARESYIRVNEQDLVNVLMERDQLRRQVASLEKKVEELEAEKNPKSPGADDGHGSPPREAADDRCAPGGEPGP
jgi:hypothetical protein